MAFVPAPNVVMAEVRALLDGQKIENRFMIDTLAAVTPSVVADVANIVNIWAQGEYFDHLPAAVSLAQVVATDMSDVAGAQHSIAPTGAFVGAIAEAPMPNEVSFCISLRTASRGRSARGRSYVLATTKETVSGNLILAARADQHVADFNSLITAIGDAGWVWIIASYRADNAPRVGGPVYFPITNCLYTDLTVDSMRRRKPGNGT
jgi:hypothetical protein